jgi:hypothetical protein
MLYPDRDDKKISAIQFFFVSYFAFLNVTDLKFTGLLN